MNVFILWGQRGFPGQAAFCGHVSLAVRPSYLAISQLMQEIAGPRGQRDLPAWLLVVLGSILLVLLGHLTILWQAGESQAL